MRCLPLGLSCVFAVSFAVSGCASLKTETFGGDSSDDIERSERMSLESRTLSRLAALERSLNDFIQAEGRVPKKLEDMVPKYLAEIPEVETGIRRHTENGGVRYYPPDVIMDGQVNGARLKDTGGWGFVRNEERVIVFVDCTHPMMGGSPWYQARGVY